MIYVISKAAFGDYNVRDIQHNANWCSCPYSDYALIPDSMVDGILATCGYCDITLNSEGTEVVSFVAREKPGNLVESVCPVLIETKEDFQNVISAELDSMPVGGKKTIYVSDPNSVAGAGATCYTVTMHKNAHNPFPTVYEHCYMADIEIHGYGEYKAFGVKSYSGDGAGEKWGISDPKQVLTEEYMADHVSARGTTDDGWTWEKWASGKFEAWKWFHSDSHNPVEDLAGAGAYFRYKYDYFFDLPFESIITPHIFVSLRSAGDDTLLGATPEEGQKWYTWDSLNIALQKWQREEMGRLIEEVIVLEEIRNSMVSECGISELEFTAALDACNGNAEEFFYALVEYANVADRDTSEAITSVLLGYGFDIETLQQVFDNTEPTRGSIHQTFSVISPYQESKHTINADIRVIGTWSGGNGSNAATVSVDKIDNGHQVTITDSNASYVFDVIDGISATHEWNGTVLTVTSASGTSSADLKGEKGDPGSGTGTAPSATIENDILVIK